uniref:Protein farnesyltransferase/geranylgeranyltransferase type-1 subunit alpha n=1 Tax=Steinernema glaseri TaxID=37863 RepID=A0A1I7YYH0_9BILA
MTSDEGDCVDTVFYSQRPEWKDITPVYETEHESCAVKIATSEHFRDAFGYFRAILAIGEKSERAFELTTTCMDQNPANYTVWQYRRELLVHLNKDLDDELDYTKSIIDDNPKNYQVWHHRKVLLMRKNDCTGELNFIKSVLSNDSKNYHAWQHRHWVVSHFKRIGPAEVEFASELIQEDIRNNSAWNYRFFILSSMDEGYSEDVTAKEITYCTQKIVECPGNESAWNYLAGILVNQGLSSSDSVREFCLAMREKKCVFAISFLLDIYVELIEKNVGVEENKNHVQEIVKELRELDPVREKYWKYMMHKVENYTNQ